MSDSGDFQLSTMFSDKTYDLLKFLALVVLPGIATLYYGIAVIWGLPNADKVVGTIVTIDTFLGLILGISNKKYQGEVSGTAVGVMNVTEDEVGQVKASLEFDGDPNDIPNFDKVTFKVRDER